jgi:dTDP-4-amino-4,6-dideoxygalactose transaminase
VTIRYPYSRPDIGEEDIAAVVAVLRRQYLTQGPEVEALERELCEKLGCREAVVVNSGTAALHLAYLAAGLGPDRGLLTSPLTFLATANAARMTGAPVAFADVDPRTGNLTPESVRDALRTATFPIGAITVVHLAGRVAPIVELKAIADEYGCELIEDACHAPGASYADGRGRRHPVGSCRHARFSCFSFHAVKHIALGEGGALCTDSSEAAAEARRLRSHGMDRDPRSWRYAPEPAAPWHYEMRQIGWNYRAPDILCALGRSQLSRLEEALRIRRQLARRYRELLADVPHVAAPSPVQDEGDHAWHLFPIDVDFAGAGKTRGEVIRELAALGIGSQVHYTPLTHQPYYRETSRQPLPGAERYFAGTLSIPMYASLQPNDLEAIAGALRKVLA